MILAISITLLGVLVTYLNLRDGIAFSFPLVLGLLLLADGVIRFLLLDQREP